MVILDVHSWVTNPGSLVYAMAASRLSWLSKKGFTYFAEIIKPNVFRTLPHLLEKFFNVLGHKEMVSLMILYYKD